MSLPAINPRAPKKEPSRQLRWQRERVAQGLCPICAKPAAEGVKACAEHQAKQRARYERNRERAIAYSLNYQQQHREKVLAYQKAWRAAHPDYFKNKYRERLSTNAA